MALVHRSSRRVARGAEVWIREEKNDILVGERQRECMRTATIMPDVRLVSTALYYRIPLKQYARCD